MLRLYSVAGRGSNARRATITDPLPQMNPSAAPANPNTSHSGDDRTPITIPAVTAPREPKRSGVMALKSRRRSRAMTARANAPPEIAPAIAPTLAHAQSHAGPPKLNNVAPLAHNTAPTPSPNSAYAPAHTMAVPTRPRRRRMRLVSPTSRSPSADQPRTR